MSVALSRLLMHSTELEKLKYLLETPGANMISMSYRGYEYAISICRHAYVYYCVIGIHTYGKMVP